MNEIIVRSQKEWGALPEKFEQETLIKIVESTEWIYLNKARENSTVVAWGNSKVVARENSTVVARENSTVVAWGNSTVVARENSTVVAWENSKVEAWGFSVAFCQSDSCKIIKGKYAHIQKPFTAKTLTDWIEIWGAKKQGKKLVLYKRVSKDFKTQEGQPWETDWSVGKTLEFKTWKPGESECGSGKFHACAAPGLCDQFRTEKADDKYITILVDKKDCFVWGNNPSYPSKISVRKAKVLYECDRFGEKINELKGGE
jgi:hypothetical protein